MTVASTARKKTFLGNDLADDFAFAFRVFTKADIAVLKSSAGVDTPLILDSDYTVFVNGDQEGNPGGTVTYPASGNPLATGDTLTIVGSELAESQATDLTTGGGFFPATIENAFDKLTILVAQLSEKIGRAVLASSTDDSPNLSVGTAASRASKFLFFDSNGDAEPAIAVETTALTQVLFNSLLAASAGAPLVGIEDAAEDFTATNVETALAELHAAINELPVAAEAETISGTWNFTGDPTIDSVQIGFKTIPVIVDDDAHTFALTDSGKGVVKEAGSAAIYTIPANASIPFPNGTVFTILNRDDNDITLTITTDTLTAAGDGTTADVTIPQHALVTVWKVASTVWYWTGVGI